MKLFRVFFASLLFLVAVRASAQDQSNAYYQAGNTLYGQKSYDQAIRYYQAAVQVNPNFWQADQGMGNCYYAKGDKANALASYQRALAINPNNPQLSTFVQSLQAQMPAQPAGMGNDLAAAPAGNPAAQPAAVAMDRNLPKEGHIVLEASEWSWAGSWTDIEKQTGGGTFSGTPLGVGLGLGAAYVFSPNIQVGAQLQFMLKQPEQVNYGTVQTYTFNENLLGGALEGEGVFPIGDGINFFGSLEAGFYTLIGSTLAGSGVFNETGDLAASGPGGKISAGVELLMDPNKTWALDIALCYQALSLSPVTETVGSTSGKLANADGSDASMDFSGPGLSVGVRIF
ncbi:MAG TPA: tetratricopeptide repeat protein [bacterium]|nr:tetratricopeptide repeat protein [bacterium]